MNKTYLWVGEESIAAQLSCATLSIRLYRIIHKWMTRIIQNWLFLFDVETNELKVYKYEKIIQIWMITDGQKSSIFGTGPYL